jgi:hypothetical protein
MIGKKISCKPGNDSYGRLARYIADASHKGEKCLMSWSAGCWSGDDYDMGILEAEAVQDLNTRTSKAKTYHLLISFRPEDEAKLTPEVFRAIEERFAVALGFSEHQRHCGVHKNTGNTHLHIAYNMIHPDRLTRRDPFGDYKTIADICRKLEQEYGLCVDKGKKKKDRLSEKAAAVEAQTGQESFESYARKHKEHILKAMENSQDWQVFHEALISVGMEIKPHGNGLVIKDLHGKHAAKASSIDRALSFKKLESRFGQFQQYQSLRPIQELSRYQAVPLHRDPERGELYTEFQKSIAERKAAYEGIKQTEGTSLAAAGDNWFQKRRELALTNMPGTTRKKLLALNNINRRDEVSAIRLEAKKQRAAIKQEKPYNSWADFLRWKAEAGNEVALAILRSQKEVIAPESHLRATLEKNEALGLILSPDLDPTRPTSRAVLSSMEPQQPPKEAQPAISYESVKQVEEERLAAAKDKWSQTRRDLALQIMPATTRKKLLALNNTRYKDEMAATWLETKKQLSLLKIQREEAWLETKMQSSLTKMQRVAAKEISSYSIDKKGVVIYMLESGGTVRDNGKTIHFSAHDPKASGVAMRFARAKWGRNAYSEGNTIEYRQAEKQQEVKRGLSR